MLVGLALGLVGAAAAGFSTVAVAAPRHVVPGRASRRPGVRFEPIAGPDDGMAVEGVGGYRGALEVTGQSGGGMAVINELGFQDYLRGIREIPASWPIEALKAQVVAARTYALWEVLAGGDSPWRQAGADLCATDSCQVYRGTEGENRATTATDRWSAAVGATDRQVLLYRGGVILSMYSDSNGGRSTSGGTPWLPSVDDPDDALSPLHHWHWTAPLSAIAPALDLGPAQSLAGLAGPSEDGTVLATVQSADGSSSDTPLSAEDFRRRINERLAAPSGLPLPLPSGRFSLATAAGSVVVDGAGWGHGIGLSQYGALGKARRGLSSADILAAYYGGLRPTVLPAGAMPPTVRVAVALDQRVVVVKASRPVRILDPAGTVIAVAPAGRWTLRPRSGGDGGPEITGPLGVDPRLAAFGPPPPPPLVPPPPTGPAAPTATFGSIPASQSGLALRAARLSARRSRIATGVPVDVVGPLGGLLLAIDASLLVALVRLRGRRDRST
ncbi:MAG: SpoIID/LytB domain-containing protein [Acidimicrobiales bacterium]